MTFNYFIKAMLAGMGFPSLVLPLIYTVLYIYDPTLIQANPLQFIPMFIPIIFGITNVIQLSMDASHVKNPNTRLWAVGICLGLIVAIIGVFILKLPALVFGLGHGLQYFPLIFLPILYGVIFRYIVKSFNTLLGI
jgi:hypothetical protein